MNRRTALKTLAGAAATTRFATPLRGERRVPGDKPNLLFLWTDEQRADTMAVYGNYRYRVPVQNWLASKSIAFGYAYVTQPVCSPNRAAVMTGLYPHQSGVLSNNIPLKNETPAVPELVNDSAYRTAYMGKWHLGDELFAQHGFQEWVSIEDIYHRYFSGGRDQEKRSNYHEFLVSLGYEPDTDDRKFSRSFAANLPVEHCKASFLGDRASDFIFRNRSEPWMLYVNFLEPHMPFDGPLNNLHGEKEAPVPPNYPGFPVEKEPDFYQQRRQQYLKQGFGGIDLSSKEGWQRLNRNYAGLCSLVDRALGQIFWTLEATGQADNTVIVYTTDHGEMMGSHSLVGKGVYYEEACRVPLLIRAPFLQSRGMRLDQPVSQIHVVPTILELMGHKVPETLPGQSLVPAMHGDRSHESDVFIQWNPSLNNPNEPAGRAVVSPEGWKLGLYEKDNNLLFHRYKDPLEMNNLYYRSHPRGVIPELQRKIEAWQKQAADRVSLSDW